MNLVSQTETAPCLGSAIIYFHQLELHGDHNTPLNNHVFLLVH